MALFEYLFTFLLFIFLVSVSKVTYIHHKQKTIIPTNWPILGMVPGLLVNIHRLHRYATEILIQNHGTVMFKGPWFANMDMLITTNPLDIHHILSKNFSNYPKGDQFHKIFDFLGDGILNSDGKIWELNHKVIFPIFKHAEFQSMMETIIRDKLENKLLPILESTCERGNEIDLQDIFQRFAFDTVCIIFLDNDPESLSLDFPFIPYFKTFIMFEEAIFLRHVTPPCLWNLQQIFMVGKEKKLGGAGKIFDQFVYKGLAQKQKEYNSINHEAEKYAFFTAIMRELSNHIGTSVDPTKFLRDTLVNLMAAGQETISTALSWFFYLLAENPSVEEKILEEIHTHLEINTHKRWSTEELDKMVYLHGALCESLRLYPPVPFNHKSPMQPEILPSGHKVDQHTQIILSFYSMARMKSIWGEDCKEFKPERWITDTGRIKHEPSYKFPIFNAGPRTCLGKHMALSQLKIVSTMIIYHFHIQLVKGHHVLPANSVVLQMKHGLKVRMNRRSEPN